MSAGWWERTVVPRIIRCACGGEMMRPLREAVVPLAHGRVFELGCGAGANQPFYDASRVTSFATVDPSPTLLGYAREEAARKGWQVDIREGVGEAIPFDDASFDCVVCTFTLCTVSDYARVLAELRRVLRPGGLLLYAEHGRAPDAAVVRWQQRIEPVWKRLFGNCHLTRPIGAAIAESGFRATPIGREYRKPGPRFAGWMEWGSAV